MSEQLNRTHVAARSTEIQLETTNELPTIIKERRSCRQFDMEKHISFSEFSRFLSTLKQVREEKYTIITQVQAGSIPLISLFM